MWSDFTKNTIDQFTMLPTIKLHPNIIKFIKDERQKIISYNIKYDINIKKINNFNQKIKDMSSTKWVDSKNLMNDIINLPINIMITWNDNKITIKCKKQHINTFIKRINTLISIIEYLKIKSGNINKVVDIYLILSSLEKKFPQDNVMDVVNANTGYTDFSNNIIFVWRYEEYEKVLFHELIHYFNMDCKEYAQYLNENPIIDIDGPHDYIEAITDYFGIIYNIIYISIITNIKIENLLKIELLFIKNQAYRLNILNNLNIWNDKPNIIIKQKTGAFSYYIIKYLLFRYVNKSGNIIDFNKDKKIDFVKLLNIILIDGMPKYNNIINIKSSRMTLLQLK
jgi:hypothetical protein